MGAQTFVTSDVVRTRFSQAMSKMYRKEVPQYGTLVQLVADVNDEALQSQPGLRSRLEAAGDLDRIDVERHGAIRVGTAEELAMLRRLFAIMGMEPVGYYDLAAAGVPVHSTAFRPIDPRALSLNPFRVFTSLLRLELVEDDELRAQAAELLDARKIFTDGVTRLVEKAETAGGLTDDEADRFVDEALETFRWHNEATVSEDIYRRLLDSHRLIADVVCFKGPHINHLTPRTLDIDAAQAQMPHRGIAAKLVVEGPPKRACPILLRQTSFKALEEPIAFKEAGPGGTHTARFGEIEQRGIALTPSGRALYDRLLASVSDRTSAADGTYDERLAEAFRDFPDNYDALRRERLAYFKYVLTEQGQDIVGPDLPSLPIQRLVEAGFVRAEPIVYEDFLPVSAAGIFQSNLGATEQESGAPKASKADFEAALGCRVHDEFDLYEGMQARSIESVRAILRASVSSNAA